jgi:hypothetical protein
MWKRFAEFAGITLLIVAGTFYYWTDGISDASHLHGSKRVEIQSSAGSVDIVGGETGNVEVTVDGDVPGNRGARVSIDQSRFPVRVKIDSIPQGAHVQITVPSDAGVAVNMSAGRLRVSGVRGDLAAVLRSGEMILSVQDSKQFASASASVLAGEIHAPTFQREKGGLFRCFSWHGKGLNTLNAHVTTGRMVLE